MIFYGFDGISDVDAIFAERVRSISGCKQPACQQISRHVIEQEFHQPA